MNHARGAEHLGERLGHATPSVAVLLGGRDHPSEVGALCVQRRAFHQERVALHAAALDHGI